MWTLNVLCGFTQSSYFVILKLLTSSRLVASDVPSDPLVLKKAFWEPFISYVLIRSCSLPVSVSLRGEARWADQQDVLHLHKDAPNTVELPQPSGEQAWLHSLARRQQKTKRRETKRWSYSAFGDVKPTPPGWSTLYKTAHLRITYRAEHPDGGLE